MERLDPEKLRKLHQELRERRAEEVTIVVHMGTCGIASGAEEVLQAVHDAASEMGKSGVVIKTSGCAGLCSREPMLTVEIAGQAPVKYVNLDAAKARRIYSEHVLERKPVTEYAVGAGCERIH
ncbi:MAG: (2Fe-2S) ferredoxin domain-containing protein [bacterium]